jgi:class I lanthipeptide synthase
VASKTSQERDFTPSGFFVFRTPLLPFDALEAWSEGLAAPAAVGDRERLAAALAEDRERLRARLRELAAVPEIREALFLASPSLHDGLAIWQSQPDGKKGQRAERALVRYLYRMAARATPFGLFSGCSVGHVETAPEARTRLAVGPRAHYERHTRLDMDYLFALCEDLGRDPAVREELLYRPNTSLYRAAGRLRYAEARLDKKVRSHHLVAVEASDYLEDTLRRAANGARPRQLAAALVAADPEGEITQEEAAEFVAELIDSQILVSDLSPPVTGPEAIHDLVRQLEGLAAIPLAQEAALKLARARDVLAELDAGGPGAPPERYLGIAAELEQLPTTVEMSRLFQLDMIKPGEEPVLGPAVMEEIVRGVELLRRLAPRRQQEALDRFRRDFSERYEAREVPLIEVLDEEVGIGFDRSGNAGAEASPLLARMAIAAPAAEPTVPWGVRQSILLAKLNEAVATGAQEIELTAEDLDRLAPPPAAGAAPAPLEPLPDGFQVMATIGAASEEALERGEFAVHVGGGGGPSGARLLGRFCHADATLTLLVEEHLRAEEAHRPDAVFAEVVHLPQGRIGNILARPLLRRYEIPFLGRSSADPEHQIPITDLLVSVAGPRIVLRSRRLGKEVIPRLTSAHNFWGGGLGVYKFLCSLQSQGVQPGIGWNWGPLDGAPFLPRVKSGRLVLAKASWWMTADEIKQLAKAAGAERYAAVEEWRQRRALPRLLTLADGDNELLIDLDNVLSVETFLDVIEQRDRAHLQEFFPGPDRLCARGPEGRFVHEVLIPFVRPARETAQRERPQPAAVPAPLRRSFPPGSEWLYAKLYTGTSTADGLLRDVVSPVVRRALGSGAAEGWFFIRYGDPEWHVRVRFHGPPARLHGEVLPALHETVAPLLDDGRLWRFQIDTYEREIERYAGPEGMLLSERFFQIDSEVVLAILEMLDGDEGADLRWRLALAGTDALIADLGLDDEARLKVLAGMRESFAREFGGGKGLQVQLDQKFRAERKAVEPLLDPANDAASPMAPALALLRERSRQLAPVMAELARLEEAGRLSATRADLAPSYAHMHVNRMIRSAARAHELVLYDMLYQIHQSRAARARKTAPAA